METKIKTSQLTGIIKTVVRESLQQREYLAMLQEVSPPGKKSERMIQHVKKSLRKSHPEWDEDKITSVAIATGWKSHNKGKVEEAGLTSETDGSGEADAPDADAAKTEDDENTDDQVNDHIAALLKAVFYSPKTKALSNTQKVALVKKIVDQGIDSLKEAAYKKVSPNETDISDEDKARTIQTEPEVNEVAKVALNESCVKLGVGIAPIGIGQMMKERCRHIVEFFVKRGEKRDKIIQAIKEVAQEADKGVNSEYASPKFLQEFAIFRENAKKFGIDKALDLDEAAYKVVSPNEVDVTDEDKARTIQTEPKVNESRDTSMLTDEDWEIIFEALRVSQSRASVSSPYAAKLAALINKLSSVTENHKVQARSAKTAKDLDNDPENVRDPEVPQA